MTLTGTTALTTPATGLATVLAAGRPVPPGTPTPGHTPSPTPPPNPADSPLGDFLTDPDAPFRHSADAVAGLAAAWWPLLATAVPTLVVLGLAGRRWLRQRRHNRLAADARHVTVLAPPDVAADGAQALWAHLAGLLGSLWRRLLDGQPHLAFEYTWTTAGLRIGVWVPGVVPPGMVERAIEAAWPGAHATTTPAAPLLPASAVATGGVLRLARPEVLPLRTRHDTDPLRALLGAAVGLGENEHAVVQVLARPVTGRRLRRARRMARRLKAGQPARFSSRLFDLLTHAPGRTGAALADPEHAAEIRAVVAKTAGAQWEVAVRYAAASTAPVAAKTDLAAAARALRGRAHALASAFAVHAERNHLTRRRLRHPVTTVNSRHHHGGDLLSVPELAALAHLPADTSAPGVERAGARAVVPPPGIAVPGPGVKPLGKSDAGIPRPVGIRVADARHHLHIIGATGSGKSTLMGNLILDDVAAGRGAVVIDPKGDVILDLLARLPEHVADKVVLLDPDDAGAPPCLNVLEAHDGTHPNSGEIDVVVDNLVGIFRRIFTAFWGPRTDDVMRAACLTLLRQPAAARGAAGGAVTLADVPRLLTEDAFRRRLTAGITDPVLRGFWSWYESMSEASRAHVIGPVQNKLRAFLLRGFVQAAIASGPSTFDMADVLNGGLCLVRLPKGVLGEETARLLGSFVVAKTWQAASHRARLGEQARTDCGLYVDEAQNFLTLPYPMEDMLAEARAYRLSLVLAHQNLAQLPRDLREGITANARSKIFFNASPEDARDLERHTTPALSAHDLSHLGAFQAAARLVVASADTAAFTLTTRPLPAPIGGRARLIRRTARTRYGNSGTTRPGRITGTDPRRNPRRRGGDQPAA